MAFRPLPRAIAGACACQRARLAARALTRAYDAALRPTGLRVGQFSLLVAIANGGGASISRLARALGMDATTLQRNVQPLLRDGLVALGPEGFRRARTASLTPRGGERLAVATPRWAEAQRAIEKRLGAGGLPRALETLDRLAGAARGGDSP